MNTRLATVTPLAPVLRQETGGIHGSWFLARVRALRDWARRLRFSTELVQDPFGPRPE